MTGWLWIALTVYWVIASRATKRSVHVERSFGRLVHVVVFALAFTLIYSDRLRIGWLGARAYPELWPIQLAGFALIASGMLWAVWARGHLGRNWSGEVTLKEDHELVQSGPYRFTRHPIYTGFLGALLGTAVVSGEARAFIAVTVMFLLVNQKSTLEEKVLVEHFGAKYLAYRKATPKLIPGI